LFVKGTPDGFASKLAPTGGGHRRAPPADYWHESWSNPHGGAGPAAAGVALRPGNLDWVVV